MTERKPGSELDVEVHRALWPDDTVYCACEFGVSCRKYARPGTLGAGYIPAYSTDLMAWPDIDGEWAIWARDDKPGFGSVISVELTWEKWAHPAIALDNTTEYEAEIGDGTWQEAAAFALAMCTLQWAEGWAERQTEK